MKVNARGAQHPDHLLRLIDAFGTKRIAVVGDLIADEFLYGQIARVSREAPVLILQYKDTIRLPGGAANAANNLLDLGCRVRMFGGVGRDEPGAALLRMLGRKGADVSRLVQLRGHATPVKTRILAGARHSAPQQVVRVDRTGMELPDHRPRWTPTAGSFRGCAGVILSDYGYGFATPARSAQVASLLRRRSIPLVVDSRFRMSAFHGVTSITPNITELEAATGIAIGNDAKLLGRVARKVVRDQGLDFLLVTQGRFGMTLIRPQRPALHLPIYGSDEVADVTGAGDTVIAVFTLALACGGMPEEAARLANYAGGIVVMKRGTATLTREELARAVQDDPC
ncbi:MAG: sugar kinase [Acidobacteria bacterium]|nr:sugar kinase [Acidobacteriota bacterium]